jgi:hypothetical protein
MDLTTLGTIITLLYCIGIFMLQWVSDWYFNAIKSPTLDYIYLCYTYWMDKFQWERNNL